MSEMFRFDELTQKTDRQMVRLITRELHRGIQSAQNALLSLGTRASIEQDCVVARNAFVEINRLTPLVGQIPAEERSRIEPGLQHLREMVEGLAVLGSRPKRDDVLVLARALWKARDCREGSPEEDWFRAERTLNTVRSTCSSAR